MLARRYGFPIYATQGTIDQMKGMSSLGAIDEGLYHTIRPDETFSIGDVEVEPFHISHDAADPVAYRFESNGKSAAVATDMGIYNDYIVEHLKGLDVVLLEANHDIQMLQVGPCLLYTSVGGAGSVIPFKSLDIVYVGAITSSGSINVMSKCPNYKKMTAGDFLLDYQSMAVRLWDGKIGGSTINVSKYYDPSTGVLSLSNLSASSSSSYVRCTVGVYAKVS